MLKCLQNFLKFERQFVFNSESGLKTPFEEIENCFVHALARYAPFSTSKIIQVVRSSTKALLKFET